MHDDRCAGARGALGQFTTPEWDPLATAVGERLAEAISDAVICAQESSRGP